MPVGTLERSAPSMFKQGPSARARWALYSALALFLMVADARFHLTGPLRQAVAAVLYPGQWLMRQPVELAQLGAGYFERLRSAQQEAESARKRMIEMALRASQVDELLQENAQLRQLLALRERLGASAQAAQVLYDGADPYSRRVIIDQGEVAGVMAGAPVLDERGVLGQVTRVLPFVSEVTLLIDRDQAIPVLNPRTGVRSVAYGNPLARDGTGLELRFMHSSADVQEGDLLTTSGIDGVYPPGLPVARVRHIEKRADSTFTRIECAPVAQTQGARSVLVLTPVGAQIPARPEPAAPTARKEGKEGKEGKGSKVAKEGKTPKEPKEAAAPKEPKP